MNHRPTTQQRQLQEEIAAQTAAFLRAGGTIQKEEIAEGRDYRPQVSDFSINGRVGNRIKRKPTKPKAKKVQ
ncbi:hypothetical protein DN730_07950 [Marinomonas piezotolerans]|uniref:Transcriptional regulator SutA RNAP-binding domain-containing protein n=1 Tax=Marinomonas piezotolerans TaxID=2213058 RepID=A0A370U966_9GAMM|nr:hypothetical protein [Marinomonas piezotolerans]RDL44329.1 hypothetical protein DN730_07950 [Marinomonas piezotolerans]